MHCVRLCPLLHFALQITRLSSPISPRKYPKRSNTVHSALHDTRFRPISTSELPTLECGITLLTDFETAASPLEWEVGTHGVRIAFLHKGRRYSATYLPSVAEEQGWSREETLTSLIRKAGCDGVRWDEAESLRVTRYQGRVTHVGYEEWRAWRNWVDATATKS